MDGILNILKPPGMTSFDVVGYLRGVTHIKKIGHTGTLDPAAVGVLPVCIGKATRAIEYITDKDKQYRAEMILGIATDTQDSTGEIIQKVDAASVSDYDFRNAVKEYIGEIEQIPPMYSAVKIGGKKLYELARHGKTIDRPGRKVTIHSIDIIKPVTVYEDGTIRAIIDVRCTKGTYIRTLINDIGDRLGVGACMSFLIRMGTGEFSLEDALTLEEVAELNNTGILADKLTSPDKVFDKLDEISLNEKDCKGYLNGQFIGCSHKEGTMLKVYDEKDVFLGIGKVIEKDGNRYLKSDKQF